MSLCTCARYHGAPDTDAERVAELVALGYDQRTASLMRWAPHLLPGRVSVSERLRARLHAEAGLVSDGGVLWGVCLFTVAFVVAVAVMW